MPDRGKILLGQKRGLELFYGDVQQMAWEKNAYESSGKFDLPKGQKIFGFAYGDVINNRNRALIRYTSDDFLRIQDQNGRTIYTSTERYGGTATFLEYVDPLDPQKRSGWGRYYLPQRIHVVDIDKDGKYELITPKNEVAVSRAITPRLRAYKSGRIECLAWDSTGLHQKWRTRDASGYIGDVMIADFDNDGKDDLVYSIVEKQDIFFSGKKSYIAAVTLDGARVQKK
jgi:hypothetical protein